MFNMKGLWCRLHYVLVMLVVGAAGGSSVGNECDWTGSGLSQQTERGVTPVYVRCREGHVTWLYPRGALRIIFQLPNNDRDFTVCIRIAKHHDDDEPDIFLEDALDFREAKMEKGTKKSVYPARLFLEGARNLIPLYAHNDGDERQVRCFRSKHGRAAVYVEALDDAVGLARTVANLRYEARPLPEGQTDFSAADCRPCSDEEMSFAFCTSEFVSRGLIVGLEQQNEFDSSRLTVKLSKLIRHTDRDGRVTRGDQSLNDIHHDTPGARYRYTVDRGRHRRRKKNKHRDIHSHVHVARHCGVSHGEGEFMFMARRRLGKLWLTCAPRLEQWAHLVNTMNEQGTAPCLLEH